VAVSQTASRHVPGHVPGGTADAGDELLGALRDLVPSAFPDGELDVAELLTALGAAEGPGAGFAFTWPGIEQARVEARSATTATLVPDPEASLNWDDARDVLIEGDNLQVLKLLRAGYEGAAKLVYIDPPYNTGETFAYDDDFSVPEPEYLRLTGQVDESGNALTSRAERAGRKHAPWLSMMFPRLVAARRLLRRDGVILVSIDDNEVHHLRLLLDAVFGPSNFLAQFVWKSKSGGANDSANVAVDHEYVVAYARDLGRLVVGPDLGATVTTSYGHEDENGRYALERLDKQNLQYSPSMDYEITGPDGTVYRLTHRDPAHPNATWRWSRAAVEQRMGELVFRDGNVYTKNYAKEGAVIRSLLVDDRFGRTRTGSTELRALFDGINLFDNPKPTRLLSTLVSVFTDAGDLVVDFFAGSGTTGEAVWQVNATTAATGEEPRRWVLVQGPEPPAAGQTSGQNARRAGYGTIFEITAERLRRAAARRGDSGLGFRVFRTRPTNLVVEPPLIATAEMDGAQYVQEALLHAQGDPVVPGAAEDAVAWELALKATDVRLDATVVERHVDGVTVHEFRAADESPDAGRLLVCLGAFTVATADALGVGGDDTLVLRGDRVDDSVVLTLAPRLAKRLILLERVAREVSL